MADQTPTPRPWKLEESDRAATSWFAEHAPEGSTLIGGPDPVFVFGVTVAAFHKRENAELAVRCVNAHDALVEAVTAFLNTWGLYGPGGTYDGTDSGGLAPSSVDDLRAALRLARGEG